MKHWLHYVNAAFACFFAALWVYNVNEGHAILASLNALTVVLYVYFANREYEAKK